MCSIVCKRHLAVHGRRHSPQGKIWRKAEWKRLRKSWTVKKVSLEAVSASLLSILVTCSKDAVMCACLVIHSDSQSWGPTLVAKLTLPLCTHTSANVLLTRVQMCSRMSILGEKR